MPIIDKCRQTPKLEKKKSPTLRVDVSERLKTELIIIVNQKKLINACEHIFLIELKNNQTSPLNCITNAQE